MLLFRVGGAQYGLEIEAIQEVADDPPLCGIPQGGPFLLGAVNLHGRVLPVIDLPALLGMAGAPRDPRLLVLTGEFHGLALAVSGIGRMLPFDAADLQLPPGEERFTAIAGVIETNGQSVFLLDVAAIVERLETIYAA
jgi:purine-binding chemotaxis protein CheW